MFYSIELLPTMAQRLGVNPADYQTDEEVLRAMETVVNAPAPEPELSVQERIAAALEYQNLLSTLT
jgi:hypothetical protein